MPFSQSYAFMTQMSSVWPTGTSVTDFSAIYKRAKVVWIGGWYESQDIRQEVVKFVADLSKENQAKILMPQNLKQGQMFDAINAWLMFQQQLQSLSTPKYRKWQRTIAEP